MKLKFKKKKNKMAEFDMDELMRLNDAYKGNEYQWIKPQDKNQLGKLVKVLDIIPGKRKNTSTGNIQLYYAKLSDGIAIETSALDNVLMRIHEDQQPLSKAEVLSIYQEPSLDVDAISKDLPINNEIIDNTKSNDLINKPISELNKLQSIDFESLEPLAKNENVLNDFDLFGMFEVKDTQISLKLNIKLPDKNLLKMMLNNAQDKDEFTNKLSNYINSNINLDSVNLAVYKLLGLDKNTKSDGK